MKFTAEVSCASFLNMTDLPLQRARDLVGGTDFFAAKNVNVSVSRMVIRVRERI